MAVLGQRRLAGDNGAVETPVPIPNTEVKHCSADGTAWETVWESRASPVYLRKAHTGCLGVGLILSGSEFSLGVSPLSVLYCFLGP